MLTTTNLVSLCSVAVEGETIEFMSAVKAFDSVLLVVNQTAIVLSLSVQRGALIINITRRYRSPPPPPLRSPRHGAVPRPAVSPRLVGQTFVVVTAHRFALGAAYVHFACLGQWIFALKSSGHVDLWDISGSKRALIDLPSYHRKHHCQAGTPQSTAVIIFMYGSLKCRVGYIIY